MRCGGWRVRLRGESPAVTRFQGSRHFPVTYSSAFPTASVYALIRALGSGQRCDFFRRGQVRGAEDAGDDGQARRIVSLSALCEYTGEGAGTSNSLLGRAKDQLVPLPDRRQPRVAAAQHC